MLHSLYGQSYDDWSVILIDDVSDASESEDARAVVRTFNAMERRIEYVVNVDKRWEVENVLFGIQSAAMEDDIVCRIDADDWLVDMDALVILDSVYRQSPNLAALWTAHRWGFSDRSISDHLPQGADPYVHPWVSSHLKTFRKKLLDGVNLDNFKGPDGKYIRRAGDQAIFLPALKRAQLLGHEVGYFPRVMYHYSIKDVPETYQTDDARFQRDEAEFLRHRGFVA